MYPRAMSDGLTELARASDQKRDAAILRATTELFAQEPTHSPEEVHRYALLASHFLPKVPEAERLRVAQRLADCPNAPLPVLLQLALDTITVAEPVLQRASGLTPIALLSIIAATGRAHHQAIAQRASLEPEVVQALESTGSLADNSSSQKMDNAALVRRATEFAEISAGRRDAWRFLSLDKATRVSVINDVTARPATLSDSPDARLDSAFRSILSAAHIVSYARSGQVASVIAAMADGLQLPTDLVAAAVNDTGGEMLAVMLKAMRLDDVQARQVFLLASPAGRDVQTFFPLAEMYSALEVDAAEALIGSWRGAFARQAASAHYATQQPFERRRDAGDEPLQVARSA